MSAPSSLVPQITRDPRQRAREFTDEAICTAEKARFATGCWTMLGITHELARENDWITGTIGDRPVFVQRFPDGLKGFENACAHRFYPLRNGNRGNGPLVCGFHGWGFGGDGQPAGLPMSVENFDADRRSVGRRLKPIDIEICGSLVFGRLASNPAGPNLIDYLGKLAAPLASITGNGNVPVDATDNLIAANWKHCQGLTLDDYHIVTIHPESFGANGYVPEGNYRYFRYGLHSAMAAGSNGVAADSFDKWIADCELGATDASTYRIMQIFPNVVVSFYPFGEGSTTVSVYIPLSATQTREKSWVLPGPLPSPGYDGTVLGGNRIHAQDRAAAEQLQRVCRQATEAPLLGKQEERVAWFDEAYASFMYGG